MEQELRIEKMELTDEVNGRSYYAVCTVIDNQIRKEMIMVKTETMELVYEETDRYYCGVLFYVNGIYGDYDDFGTKEDGGRYYDSFDTPHCADMHFEPGTPSEDCLKKYRITEDDFDVIADMLVNQLAFGCCGMCW